MPGEPTVVVPVLVLGLLVLDTFLVVFSRLRRGRNLLAAGHDHISHRLLASGLRVPIVTGSIQVAAAVTGLMALVLVLVSPGLGWTLVGILGIVGMVGIELLEMAPIGPSPPTSRRRRGFRGDSPSEP